MEKLKTLWQVQETINKREEDKRFDYYDNEDLCIIHFKFGRAQKGYCGLTEENGLTPEFIEEYKKYFNGKGEIIKSARDLVAYIVKYNLPVVFYANYSDVEMSIMETLAWLDSNEPKKI